jgi:TonB family protein
MKGSGKTFACLFRQIMSQAALSEVFTTDELARAAGVERLAIEAALASGELRFIAGTRYISGADAVRVGHRLVSEARPESAGLALATPRNGQRHPGMPAFVSTLVHAVLLVAAIWSSLDAVDAVPVEDEPKSDERLVFIMTPGPGGGGGGGGLRNPLPPPRIQRRGPDRPRISVPAVTPKPVAVTARREEPPKELTPVTPPVPKPIEPAPEPLPARVLVAPVVVAATSPQDREGVIQNGRGDADSQGKGDLGGAGSGRGTGNGEGNGAGLGVGSGGGTGGGPYRPGSGIEPPRLLREIKPEYTDEARRRGVTGEVVLEVVVRHDGTVGEVRMVRGLGYGLDQRAVDAVRQWRFSPARRQGAAVDVIVEVAVDFALR